MSNEYVRDCRIRYGLTSRQTCLPTTNYRLTKRLIITALLHPTPTPFAMLGGDQFSAIQTLSRIFSNVTASPPTAPTPKAPRPSPAGALQTYCYAPSTRVPNITPPASPPRVTMVPATHIPDNPPPKPVAITPVKCKRKLNPVPTPAIIKPERDDPVLQSRYHLRPRPRSSPYNRWEGGTQPR